MHIKTSIPKGDGFFDYLPGITVDPRYGRIIFPKVEPFGEFLFDLLDNPESVKEDYDIDNSFNKNQDRYVFKEMYGLYQKPLHSSIRKRTNSSLKGRYKSEGGEGINIGAFNVPQGLSTGNSRGTIASRRTWTIP